MENSEVEVLAFGVQTWDELALLEQAFAGRYRLRCLQLPLNATTATLAEGHEVVSCSVNAELDAPVLRALADGGTRLVAQRSIGYDNVDLAEARRLGLTIARVEHYSPFAVAEFAWTLALAVNRGLARAVGRTRDFDFRLDGLLGRQVHGMVVGVIGTGRVGTAFTSIASGFGVRLLGWDIKTSAVAEGLGLRYVELDELLERCDLVSLHVPLLPETHHLLDEQALRRMKKDAILVNSSRGGLIDEQALLAALREGRIGGVGLDLYEEEPGLYLDGVTHGGIADHVLARLMAFPNVLVTSHQAYFTRESIGQIVATTLDNIDAYFAGRTTDSTLVAPASGLARRSTGG